MGNIVFWIVPMLILALIVIKIATYKKGTDQTNQGRGSNQDSPLPASNKSAKVHKEFMEASQTTGKAGGQLTDKIHKNHKGRL